jgi:hypothetical protein
MISKLSTSCAAFAIAIAIAGTPAPSVADADGGLSATCSAAIDNDDTANKALHEREKFHDERVSAYRIKAQSAAYPALKESVSCGNRSVIAETFVLNAWVSEARGAEYMRLFESVPGSSTCGRYYALTLVQGLSAAWATLGVAKKYGGSDVDPFSHVESLLRYDAQAIEVKLDPLDSTEARERSERLEKQWDEARQTYARNCEDITDL